MRNICILTNQVTADSAIEIWFIQNIVLNGRSFNLEWDLNNIKDSVVIYLELGPINMDIIKTLKINGNKVVLFKMGDEFLNDFDPKPYQLCDFVFRNYYFKSLFLDAEIGHKIFWIPNGYKSGVGPRNDMTLRPADKRKFLSSFLGWLDNARSYGNERNIFADIAKSCQENILIQSTEYFNKGFNAGMYSTVLEYSVFCLCPAGNSPETIRLYDALEMGCIPVCLKHPFLFTEHAFLNPPFCLLDDWTQLPEFLKEQRALMSSKPDHLLQLQRACIDWWSIYKKTMAMRIDRVLYDLSLT